MTLFVQSEATAARRRFNLFLVDATDGISAETGEAAGQPQISKNGAAFGNTTATLTAVGNGSYYVELTATELDTLGSIVVRYKSANTAEFNMPADVVAFNVHGTPSVNVAQWLGSAAATPTVAGVPEVDVTHWIGTAAATPTTAGVPEVDLTHWLGVAPNALVSNRVDASVGAMAANVLTAAATATDFSTEVNAAVLAVLGALADAAADGDPTSADTVMMYVKQLVNVLVGTAGVVAFPAAAAPGNGVSLAEVLRAVYDDTNELQVDDYPTSIAAIQADTNDLQTKIGTPAGASLAADLAAIEAQTDDIGTAGAGLTAVPWNAAWDAEVQSEVQDAIEVNHLDHLLAVDYDPASKPGVATALLNELVESDGGVSRYTANALEQAPTGGSAPTAADIADAVWDETLSGHLAAGSTGEALNGAGAAGDPWTTALPGAYGVGSAGFLIGTYVDDDISERATQTSVDALQTDIDNIQTRLPAALVSGRMDASIGAVAAGAIGAAAFAAGALDAVWSVTTRLLTAGTNIVLAKGTGITGFNDVSTAQVNAEVLDVLQTDTFAEPAQGAPAATASLVTKIGFLYKLARNRVTGSATEIKVYDAAGSVVDHKATHSDNGTTYDRSEFGTGP